MVYERLREQLPSGQFVWVLTGLRLGLLQHLCLFLAPDAVVEQHGRHQPDRTQYQYYHLRNKTFNVGGWLGGWVAATVSTHLELEVIVWSDFILVAGRGVQHSPRNYVHEDAGEDCAGVSVNNHKSEPETKRRPGPERMSGRTSPRQKLFYVTSLSARRVVSYQ